MLMLSLVHSATTCISSIFLQGLLHTISQACHCIMQNTGDADEQGGHGDHANGVQRSGSGMGRNGPKGGRGRPGRGRGQMGMRGDMGMGGPMAPMGAGMMGGMQAMPGQMFVLAPGKPTSHTQCCVMMRINLFRDLAHLQHVLCYIQYVQCIQRFVYNTSCKIMLGLY